MVCRLITRLPLARGTSGPQSSVDLQAHRAGVGAAMIRSHPASRRRTAALYMPRAVMCWPTETEP